MRSRFAGLVLMVAGGPVAAQGIHATELGIGSLAVWSRRAFYGGGVDVATRPGGEGRLAAAVLGGSCDGHAALRLELTAQFLVSPTARTGLTPYGGVGLGFVAAHGARSSEVLVLLLGVEQAAARASGWFGDVGIGGGLRVRIGFRWRRLSPGWS